MKTGIRVTQETYRTSIQFAHALAAAAENPSPLTSTVRLQAFRVPWAPLKGANSALASPRNAPTLRRDCDASPQTLLVASPGRGPLSAGHGSTPQLDEVLEEIRYRMETKSSVLEEALQRLALREK